MDDQNPDPNELIRLVKWAIARRHHRLASFAARTLRMSWGDFVQETLAHIYATGFSQLGHLRLSTIAVNQARWTIMKLLRQRPPNSFECGVLQNLQATDDLDEQLRQSELKEWWKHAALTVTYRQRLVLELRCGFDGHEYTMAQCGKILRRSKETVRQIESKALRRLQAHNQQNRVARVLADINNKN